MGRPATADRVLALDDVWKRYGRSGWALRGVTADFARGGITALVGPNGAGKMTLLRLWVGFEQPTKGTAEVLGSDPWHERTRSVARIGYIAQHPALYARLTVQEHLDLARHLRPSFDTASAAQRVRRLGMDPTRSAGRLSGGQQAQLGLVLAVGTRAEILLLDEPLASLDPLARRDFLRLLLETSQELGATTVLSSHVVAGLEDVCGRIIILAGGRIGFDATVTDAIHRHFLAAESDVVGDGARVIGSFIDLHGPPTTLFQTDRIGDPPPNATSPTLEEVVMGYLAQDRA